MTATFFSLVGTQSVIADVVTPEDSESSAGVANGDAVALGCLRVPAQREQTCKGSNAQDLILNQLESKISVLPQRQW